MKTHNSYTQNELGEPDSDARRELNTTMMRFRWFAYPILILLAGFVAYKYLS